MLMMSLRNHNNHTFSQRYKQTTFYYIDMHTLLDIYITLYIYINKHT